MIGAMVFLLTVFGGNAAASLPPLVSVSRLKRTLETLVGDCSGSRAAHDLLRGLIAELVIDVAAEMRHVLDAEGTVADRWRSDPQRRRILGREHVELALRGLFGEKSALLRRAVARVARGQSVEVELP